MDEVGIRELKAHLSGYVRRVHAEGTTLAVTDRGRIVAVLAPPPLAAEPVRPSLRDRVMARGGRPAVDHSWPATLPPLPAEIRQIDAAALLADLRGER